MKRSVKILLTLSTLAIFGVLAHALRPAYLPDTCESLPPEEHIPLRNADCEPLGGGLPAVDILYTVDITAPKGETRYVGQVQPNAFTLLREAEWHIRISTKDGALWVEPGTLDLHAADPWSHVLYSAVANIDKDFVKEKQPDGSYRAIYYVNIVVSACVQPSFWKKSTSTFFWQTLRVDPVGGTVDMASPRVPLRAIIGHGTAVSKRYPMQKMPSALGDEPKEQALNFLLFNLGKIDNQNDALSLGETLPNAAKKMLDRHTDAGKPWPECWGEAAPLAQRCAKSIVPTLLYLQENSCFGGQKLADFINGPDFARFFGESFADKAPDPLDEPIPPFVIEKMDTTAPETNNADD